MMLYDIVLRIAYAYDNPADSSRHIIRLSPADLPGEQRQVAGTFTVDPLPEERRVQRDFFGNTSMQLVYLKAHKKINFTVQSRVDRYATNERLDTSPPLAMLAQEIAEHRSLDASAPHHFVGPTLRVPIDAATTHYARARVTAGMSVRETVAKIGEALNRDFKYDPKATTVETPMLDAFNGRRGVCQDFSHIMIACLRGLGIPAGYVSGFLRTIPPPGKKRLAGADAMHAWVRVWCGREMGWLEYDPTNRVFAGSDHVVIARGRDYADVAPIKGILRSYGAHTSTQTVDMVPVTPRSSISDV
jgi:transglutaminase-like putative cysteine protease